MKVSIIVPAFNESKKIGSVLEALYSLKFPVIVVDDGSSDNTYEIAKKYEYKNKSLFKVLRHRLNLGKGAALKTGCEAAFLLGADAVILVDGDGQHNILDIPKFISALETNKYDILFGSRKLSFKTPFVRMLGNKLASFLVVSLYGIYISDLLCGFRALTRNGYKKLNLKSKGYGIETEMVVRSGRIGLKSCEIPVETIYYDRFKGVTILDAFGVLVDVLKWRLEI